MVFIITAAKAEWVSEISILLQPLYVILLSFIGATYLYIILPVAFILLALKCCLLFWRIHYYQQVSLFFSSCGRIKIFVIFRSILLLETKAAVDKATANAEKRTG